MFSFPIITWATLCECLILCLRAGVRGIFPPGMFFCLRELDKDWELKGRGSSGLDWFGGVLVIVDVILI